MIKPSKIINLLGISALAMTTLGVANAQSDANYNRISFSVEAKTEVDNDEMRATLTKTTEAKTAKEVAKTLNDTINNALAIAKKYPDVIATTGRHSTYPRYGSNNSITGFTGNASIQIKSQNFEQSSQLIADLQTMMALDHLSFNVSDKTRDNLKKQLTLDATKQFQEEAATISQAFGAKDYKIVNVQLGNNNNNYYSDAMPVAMSMSREKSVGIENLSLESGKATLSYNASGTIELIR
ncbi:SIMPL domain-containing protein [Moraxella sp.]|uniref:SIMPL domain-containing protein n=1 Tax=Moraxella sp. TaxID=479 RepID=UPI00262DA93D|nr:SIMPL domain-containing protein [Moraxella sp.]MCP3896941.1 SIMPL domain-containing protein [Moraxella sp.]